MDCQEAVQEFTKKAVEKYQEFKLGELMLKFVKVGQGP